MTKSDMATLRKERLNHILIMLRGVGTVDVERFIAAVQICDGLTERRVREYITLLHSAGLINFDAVKGTVAEKQVEGD